MTKKTLTIGLEGCLIHTGNLGCSALTWSLLAMLERIAEKNGLSFRYTVFEYDPDPADTDRLCGQLSIAPDRLTAVKTTSLFHPLAQVRHPGLTGKVLSAMRACDCFIDLTQGDSFADLYGDWRFSGFTRIKEIILRMNKPLILGPQTFGPFRSTKNADRAAGILRRARCVMARDLNAEARALFERSGITPLLTCDLAFGLPYQAVPVSPSGKVRVGINASSLLTRNRTEPTELRIPLRTDYDLYLETLLESLTQDERFEVFLIPHVGEDAGPQFRERFPEAHVLPAFRDPADAKAVIASMDILIAARMHAVIAALSSGTAVVPTGYSPKFEGLTEKMNYPYLADLTKLDTDQAVRTTLQWIGSRAGLRRAAQACRPVFTKDLELTETRLTGALLEIAGRPGEEN